MAHEPANGVLLVCMPFAGSCSLQSFCLLGGEEVEEQAGPHGEERKPFDLDVVSEGNAIQQQTAEVL
eukprot:305010-Pelagomonas_calceolata.AAC.3